MARSGITYTNVSNAALIIQGNNQNPTVDRVLAQLGTGSKSTIAPLLKQWKTEQGQGAGSTGLPDEILKAVKGIHDRLQQSAEMTIEHAMEVSQKQASISNNEIKDATTKIERLSQGNDQLKTQLESAKANDIELRDKLETEYIAAARLTAENEALTTQFEQAKSDIIEQKQEARHIRESLEHYQSQAAEDRQLEREQFQISKHQLEERIQATNLQLNNELKRSRQYDAEKIQLNNQVKQLSNDLDQSKKSLQTQSLEINQLSQQLVTTVNTKGELKQINQDLESKCNTFTKENSNLQSSKQLLEHEIRQLADGFSEVNEKLSVLDDENKVILQEKAMLQGQFKQLQDSL
ncbi:MAG: DNA-binding protein [Methylococcales bacterium]